MQKSDKKNLRERLDRLKIIQGPLAGVSCWPFRRSVWQHSSPAWVYTEMVLANTVLQGRADAKKRYLGTYPDEGPGCLQVAVSCPKQAAQVAREAQKTAFSVLDLNSGCPVKKIRKRGQGSKLLESPEKLRQILQAMRDHCDLAISVKIRLAASKLREDDQRVLEAVNQASPDYLVVHGRSYQDDYTVPCDHHAIAWFCEQTSIPVIGNGDAKDAASAQALLDVGCAGVMVSRASVGAPWCIGQIQRGLKITNTQAGVPSKEESWQSYLTHLNDLHKLYDGNDQPIRGQAQGLAKYYAKRNGWPKDWLDKVARWETILVNQQGCAAKR